MNFEFSDAQSSSTPSHIIDLSDDEESAVPFPKSPGSSSSDEADEVGISVNDVNEQDNNPIEETTLCPFCGACDFNTLKEHLAKCEFYDGSVAGVPSNKPLPNISNDDYGKLCPPCNDYIPVDQFIGHLKDVHQTKNTPDYIFKSWEFIDPTNTFVSRNVLCSTCGDSGFKSPLDYIDHINTHGDYCQEVYQCPCGYDSFFHGEIFDHIANDTSGKCNISQIGWPTYALEFRNKYKIVQRDYTNRKYKCMYCDYTSSVSKDVCIHTANSHKKKSIPCTYPYCKQMFATEVALREHTNARHLQSVFCITCRLSFTRDEYRVHQYCCEMGKAKDICPLCNKEITIQSLMEHFSDPEHLEIEKEFMKGLVYGRKIPCFVCSRKAIICFPNIVELLKHYCTKHRVAYKNVLQHMASIKKGVSFRAKARPKARLALKEQEERNMFVYDTPENEPFTVQEMEQYSMKQAKIHKPNSSDELENVVALLSPQSDTTTDDEAPNSVECIVKIEHDLDEEVIEEKELMECFLCHVQTVRSPNYLRTHFEDMIEGHEERINQWKNKFNLTYIPCPECDTKDIKTIEDGFHHYEIMHGFDILQLYDHIAKYRTRPQHAGGNFPKLVHPCVFCGTPLAPLASKIKYHFYKIHNTSHKVNLEKWKQLNGYTGFPCNYCERESHTIISALQHCESDHNENVTDYYTFMSDMIPEALKDTRKSCYLCKEKFPTVWVDIKYHFTKANHLVQSNNWKAANYLNSFPCGYCNIQSLKTIGDGINHYCEAHNSTADEYYDYFVFYSEELRMNALAAIEGGESTSNYIPMRDGKVAISKLRGKRKASP